MSLLTVLIVVLSSTAFAAQVWGYHRHFRQIGSVSWRLRGMSLAFIGAYAAQLVMVLRRPVEPLWGVIGCVAIAGAIALWAWSVRASGQGNLGLAFSTGDQPSVLVTHGPYRWVRHPFYSAYMLHWLGGWIASPAWLTGIMGVAAAATCVAAALREERRFADSRLSELYEIYKERTGMFLPSLRSATQA